MVKIEYSLQRKSKKQNNNDEANDEKCRFILCVWRYFSLTGSTA